MKRLSRWMMVVFTLTLIFSGIACDQEKNEAKAVDLNILPAPVTDAFKAAYPQAVIKGTAKEIENGLTVYEIESVDGKLNRDLLYAADGKVISIEESITPDDLPAPVKQTLAAEYPGAKILKAEIMTKDGIKVFELSLQVKDKTVSVEIDPQGRIVK